MTLFYLFCTIRCCAVLLPIRCRCHDREATGRIFGYEWDHGELRYFPKENTATVFCTDFLLWYDQERWLPIIVFPQNSKAASATLSLTVIGSEAQESYQLESSRQEGGYCLFSLPLEDNSGEVFWLLQQAITGSWQEYVLTGTVDIRIDFYDHSGNLVDTYSKTVTK